MVLISNRGYNGFAEPGGGGGVAGAGIAPPYGQASFNNLRRSSLAVGPFMDGGAAGYRKPGRSASVVQYQQYQQSVLENNTATQTRVLKAKESIRN